MRAVRRLAFVLLLVAGCGGGWGVRTPARLDLAAMVKARGAADVRRALVVRVLDDPRDVQARLALAELAEQMKRPSEAIEQLEAVLRLGGPIGTRWDDEDRARLGRLLLARGRARLARGAASALRDLERAGSFGVPATKDELVQAQIAIAIANVKHVAVKERAQGRAVLAKHARLAPVRSGTSPAGAPNADAVLPDEAAWLGAKADALPVERGRFGAWLWTINARREAYEQLKAWHDATKPPRDEALQSAYLRALVWWSPVWLGEAKPPPAEDLVGPERCWFPGTDCTPSAPEEAPLPPPPELDTDPRAAMAARYAAARFTIGGAPDASALAPIARAFYRDATIAERLGRDLVASAPDAALAHATLGALFDALGDPARARAQWQAAADASAEPAFVRGLAEAAARTRDGSGALVFGTQAAAAWGDPAVVWTSLAATLDAAGQHVEALTAARNALDLAGPEVLPRAHDVAIAASRALDRKAQVEALTDQRAQLGPRERTEDAGARAAINAHRERPTASSVAQLWVASRAHPRDVELRATLLASLDADDPRRATIVAELVALAGDPDSDRALAAVTALRR